MAQSEYFINLNIWKFGVSNAGNVRNLKRRENYQVHPTCARVLRGQVNVTSHSELPLKPVLASLRMPTRGRFGKMDAQASVSGIELESGPGSGSGVRARVRVMGAGRLQKLWMLYI